MEIYPISYMEKDIISGLVNTITKTCLNVDGIEAVGLLTKYNELRNRIRFIINIFANNENGLNIFSLYANPLDYISKELKSEIIINYVRIDNVNDLTNESEIRRNYLQDLIKNIKFLYDKDGKYNKLQQELKPKKSKSRITYDLFDTYAKYNNPKRNNKNDLEIKTEPPLDLKVFKPTNNNLKLSKNTSKFIESAIDKIVNNYVSDERVSGIYVTYRQNVTKKIYINVVCDISQDEINNCDIEYDYNIITVGDIDLEVIYHSHEDYISCDNEFNTPVDLEDCNILYDKTGLLYNKKLDLENKIIREGIYSLNSDRLEINPSLQLKRIPR